MNFKDTLTPLPAKLSPTDNAKAFVDRCRKYGFDFSVSDRVVKIWKRFPIGDGDAFGDCEMAASIIFDFVPLKGGSVWGTDGGSIGGATAMKTGLFKLNKSGDRGGKAFAKAVAKVR